MSSTSCMSLDVDGAELSVLKTFDWTVPIGVLLVELDGSNRDKDEAVRALLRSHGMRFALRVGFRKYSEVWEGLFCPQRSTAAPPSIGYATARTVVQIRPCAS